MDGQLTGLLECPAQGGWIEFTYAKGDKVRELKKALNKRWGRDIERKGPHSHIYSDGWAVLAEDNDGAYVSLRDTDEIPSGGIGQIAATAIEFPSDESRFVMPEELSRIAGRGVLDLFFAGVSHRQPREGGESILQKARYRLPIQIDRKYSLPPENEYAVRLLALITIVGG